MAGTLAAILAAVVGYFVVLRNLSFAGHALGHVGFAGATGAALVGLSPFVGQLVLTVLAGLLMGSLGSYLYKRDMTIGIVLAFALGLGSLFLSLYQGYAGQVTSILFGDLLGVSVKNLVLISLLTLASLLALGVLARPLLFASLEPELAQAKGIRTTVLSVIFLGLVAIAVTIAAQVVGVLLVFTLLVGPPAIALRRAKNFWQGMIFSLLLGILIVWLGLFLTVATNWPLSFWVSALVLTLYII